MISSINKDLESSSIWIATHVDAVHRELDSVISSYFSQPEYKLLKMSLRQYRALMYETQVALNKKNFNTRILSSIKYALMEYLQTEDFLVQSNLYLRASRPFTPYETENIGWHRESFYGPNLARSINICTPIKGVSEKNTLRYIPKSQLIPDENIVTRNIGESSTERFSVGHKLGFNYDPKIIEKGVDFSSAQPLYFAVKRSAIFSGNLIHGAAVNRCKNIRFSVDFQIIKKEDYSTKNKTFHFSSGLPYFEEFEFS